MRSSRTSRRRSTPALEIHERHPGRQESLPLPETEDLNLNGNLDTEDGYYEYTIDLSDGLSRYLVTDLQQLKASAEPGYSGVPIDNGWRRYRIPIEDSVRVQFGVPT